MSARPVWLLDVDGPINASRCGWGAAPHRRHISDHLGGDYVMRWCGPLIVRIRALMLAGVEVRWSTTWAHDRLEDVFGLPPIAPALTLAESDSRGGRLTAAKRQAAVRVLQDERRPLIWTEDREIWRADTPLAQSTVEFDTCFIAPRANRGLREEHMDYIEAWARRRL